MRLIRLYANEEFPKERKRYKSVNMNVKNSKPMFAIEIDTVHSETLDYDNFNTYLKNNQDVWLQFCFP